MALTLNGSTGVVEANIADNAITTAKIASANITNAKLASGAITRSTLPSGTVLQTVQAYKTDIFSTTSTSLVDVSGLSVTITPTSSNSKFMIMVNIGS
jgi:hypothetical protein